MNISTISAPTAIIAPACSVPPWLGGGNCPMHEDAPYKILPVPGPDDEIAHPGNGNTGVVPPWLRDDSDLVGPSEPVSDDQPRILGVDDNLVPLPGPVDDAKTGAGEIKAPLASSWG